MAGLDLSGVAEFIDSEILVDTIRITDDQGAADAVLDEGTGELIEPTGDPILYDGPGAVQPIDGFSAVADPDVQRVVQTTDARYRALLPISTPAAVAPGHKLRVTAQGGENPNPQILARRYEVVELAEVATLAVVQVVYLKQL